MKLDVTVRDCKVHGEDQDVHSATWLRSSLSCQLRNYECAIPKIGTLIYRNEGDLVQALTVAFNLAIPP